MIPPEAVSVILLPGQEEGDEAVSEGVIVAILAAKVA